MLADAVLHSLALSVSRALLWWRRLTRRSRSSRRRYFRAIAFFGKRLELKVWRGWMRAVRDGRDLKRHVIEALRGEMAVLGRGRRAADAQRRQQQRKASREWSRRSLLSRGCAAFRQRGVLGAMNALALASARRLLRSTGRRRLLAAIGRWVIWCGTELRRRIATSSSEVEMRAELLSQSRAASAAVERENDELRIRCDSLSTDLASLQDLLAQHRTEAEASSEALREAETRHESLLGEMEALEARRSASLDEVAALRSQLADERREADALRESHAAEIERARGRRSSQRQARGTAADH